MATIGHILRAIQNASSWQEAVIPVAIILGIFVTGVFVVSVLAALYVFVPIFVARAIERIGWWLDDRRTARLRHPKSRD